MVSENEELEEIDEDSEESSEDEPEETGPNAKEKTALGNVAPLYYIAYII